MTDREMLELAAKAAGIVGTYYRGFLNDNYEDGIVYICNDGQQAAWNPLDDDGDALRLAVKLGFAVSVEFQVGSTVVLWGPPMVIIREQHGTDPYAATRMAIVRAAAEVGRTME